MTFIEMIIQDGDRQLYNVFLVLSRARYKVYKFRDIESRRLLK